MGSDTILTKTSLRRYEKTLDFIKSSAPQANVILDLGIENPFSKILKDNQYQVYNTHGEDLDDIPESVMEFQGIELVTALEIFEHLLNPLSVLKCLPCDKLIASVPLSLWFAKAYKSKTDKRDRHFHEFEDWQFDWLLEKAGWKIIASEKWTSPTGKIGLRPFLREITPRYYIVYAERIK